MAALHQQCQLEQHASKCVARCSSWVCMYMSCKQKGLAEGAGRSRAQTKHPHSLQAGTILCAVRK